MRLPVSSLKIAVAFLTLAFCAAPVPGDVGGCGQEPQELDPETFFWSKQNIECEHCRDCELTSKACQRACGDSLVQAAFPEACAPLVHDGEVCLRALDDGSCDDFRSFMSDQSPQVPSECAFCPVRAAP